MNPFVMFAFLFVCGNVLASNTQASDESIRTGYYWGKDWIVDPEKEEIEKPKHPDLPKLPSSEELLNMHPDELRALEKERMDYALYKQTPEAVADYYRIITAIRKKARTFAALASYNSMTNIELSTNPDAPSSNQGIQVKRQLRQKTIATKLDGNRDEFALVMFTSKTCPYCEPARSTSRLFNQAHGWLVKEVDIDQEPQLAARHDIQYTPTTLVIRKNDPNSIPIAFGVESLPSLEENAYRAVRLLTGEISPKQFFSSEEQKGRALDPESNF
ncbi:MAG: conjugal transfer protein TraF [Anaerolineae bacterium]|nr:conjugal transfer protein TraF [Anaerolineae bacterium]